MGNKQNLISSPKESQALALSECSRSRNKLDELIGVSLSLQKLYGRDVANAGTVIEFFQRILSGYPAEKSTRAFELWLERSQEFPTPADIISLIKRNGKPPLRESEIIAIRKKDGSDRTPDDWAMLREWEAQQQDGWRDDADPVKDEATLQENIRLRQRVRELEAENERAWTEIKSMRSAAGAAIPDVPLDDKVQRTVDAMRQGGAPQADIDEFLSQYSQAA